VPPDSLNARIGQNLRELCAGLAMARQSVSKHLAVLEAANLRAAPVLSPRSPSSRAGRLRQRGKTMRKEQIVFSTGL
jgi:hypothetical protein